VAHSLNNGSTRLKNSAPGWLAAAVARRDAGVEPTGTYSRRAAASQPGALSSTEESHQRLS